MTTGACTDCTRTESCKFTASKCNTCYVRGRLQANASLREYNAANAKQWRDKNPQRQKDSTQAWLLQHPGYHRKRSRHYQTTLDGRFANLKGSARARGLPVGLSLAEFSAVIALPCYYCGSALGKSGTQLDRVDNSTEIGYTKDNVVPCCTVCNRVRSNKFSMEEFAEVIRLLQKMRGKSAVWRA